ncbi:class I SAM-dependent methyltransferase [Flavitalea sp.]|nr:class I SAM-dependent methyltransferase [Flavitalea sp.]
MNNPIRDINEKQVEEAFTAQSVMFDKLYGDDSMIAYKRTRVRQHISKYLKTGSELLELNCGTGEDAFYFARHGFRVHATDMSSGMLDELMQKKSVRPGSDVITVEQCSFTKLSNLKNKGPFDYVYSNFGGLNCTGDLNKVLADLTPLIKPGGFLTLVIISKFCLWESLLIFKGKFRTAFRRFFSGDGRQARAEGKNFKCWYYNPSFIINTLKDQFSTVALEGLCTIVPPSYLQGFPEKHPRIFAYLCRQENRKKSAYPWKYMGDYFIITLQKRS